MAGYGGYGLQALTQGFQSGFSMATQARQLKEQRLEKEELKKKKDALALVVGNIEGKASEYSKGGWSNQEVGDFSALIHGSGVEIQGYFKGYLESIESGNKERIEEYKTLIDEFTKGLDDLDLSDIQKAVDAFSPNIKSEDGKKYLDVNTNMKRSLAQKAKPKVEVFNNIEEFRVVHGNVPFEYNDKGQLRLPPTAAKLNEYQMKIRDIKDDKDLTDTEKKRGLYKIRTGLDIKVNNDEDDYTTVEGKRTADFGKQELFGYTAQDGILVAGLIPSRLVRTLSLGKPATQEEQDSVMYNWNARKEAVAKLGGAMAVEYIENIIGQMFKITKEKEIPKGGLLEDFFNSVKGENVTETEIETNDTPATAEEVLKPGLSVNQKLALMATLPDSELEKAALQAAEDDIKSVLYKALYDMCKERGLID